MDVITIPTDHQCNNRIRRIYNRRFLFLFLFSLLSTVFNMFNMTFYVSVVCSQLVELQSGKK